MIDNEYLLRAAAVVAAAVLVAAPGLVGYAQAAAAWLTKRAPAVPPVKHGPDDAFTVIEIARRLQASGNKRGVELCQQLIDVLLQPEGTTKR